MGEATLSLRQRCAAVELLVLDVDGVLTAGGIVYGAAGAEAGLEIKAFHVRDGSALKRWHAAGKRTAIVTGRSSPVVGRRAGELGVGLVVQGAADKGLALRRLLAEAAVPASAVCAVGDDLPDVAVLRQVGLAVAVGEGCAEARQAAHYVTRSAGGAGAVRETIERILRCQGRWLEEGS